jgi:signal transduction histidine kinase
MNTFPLMPHAVCWASAPKLIWTMVVTNVITFASYLILSITLVYLASRTRRVIARDWRYFVVGFALFIIACGSTHLLEVVTTWIPVFWIAAWVNIVTAVLSAYVAVMLIRRAATIAFSINDYADRLRKTEDQKLQMQESLLAARKIEDWSRMSATVSHEIRGPLEAIQNLQHLITTSTGVTKEVAELARTTAEEATRVLKIADSSLSFIRQGSSPEPVDICAALDSVRFLLEPLIRDRGIEFHVEVNGDCIVECLPGETRQVLLNIVRNACEAVTKRGARVTVTLNGAIDSVQVIVVDEGPGISPEILPRLFEFGVSTKGANGNGMGLWTVRQILTKHGGSVKVLSEPDNGTRFDLWWPRKHMLSTSSADESPLPV